jgi:hypothetical protein
MTVANLGSRANCARTPPGQESVVADAHESTRHDVHHEATDDIQQVPARVAFHFVSGRSEDLRMVLNVEPR